jgi:hypothetical protein
MDPQSLHVLLNGLGPMVAALMVFACPVGILWVIKHHQLRMKELEAELQGPGRSEARLAAIERRLAAIETALTGAPALSGIEERAALLEGPATSAGEAPAAVSRVRQR